MALLLQHCGKVVGLLLWVQVPLAVAVLQLPWVMVLGLVVLGLVVLGLVVLGLVVLGLVVLGLGLVAGALSAGQAVLGSVGSGWLASFHLASLHLAISPTFPAPSSSIAPATTEPEPICHQIAATRT